MAVRSGRGRDGGKGWGGARPNSARPIGSKYGPWQSTQNKELARQVLRDIVTREMDVLVHAQMSQAKGIYFLVLRDRHTGQFIKRLNARSLQRHVKQANEHEVIEVWQKDPSTQAFQALLNWTIDMPKQQEQELRLTGEWEKLVAILRSARAVPPTEG